MIIVTSIIEGYGFYYDMIEDDMISSIYGLLKEDYPAYKSILGEY